MKNFSYGDDFPLLGSKVVYHKPRKRPFLAQMDEEAAAYLNHLFVNNMDLSEFTHPPISKDTLRFGQRYRTGDDPLDWNVFFPASFLPNATTGMIQKHVCAAINSHRRLHMAIGVEPCSQLIEGCALTTESIDMIGQAIDFAMGREFVPAIDPEMVALHFRQVEGGPSSDKKRFVIEITCEPFDDGMCQLSSGRVFYVSNSDELCQFDSINQVRLMLLSKFDKVHNNERTGSGVLLRWMLIATCLMAIGFSVGRMIR